MTKICFFSTKPSINLQTSFNCRFFLNRFSVSCNLFRAFFPVTRSGCSFFKKEIENLKAVFSLSNNEESSSIKPVNDRLVVHLLEENKTKNDIIKILAGNFSVNVNKPQVQISL